MIDRLLLAGSRSTGPSKNRSTREATGGGVQNSS
jgi:hypothetical protein